MSFGSHEVQSPLVGCHCVCSCIMAPTIVQLDFPHLEVPSYPSLGFGEHGAPQNIELAINPLLITCSKA
jgi:hypothetical protein